MKRLIIISLFSCLGYASENQNIAIFDSIIKNGFTEVPALRHQVLTPEGRVEILRNRASERLNQITFNRALKGITPYQVETSRYYQAKLESVQATFMVPESSLLYSIKNHFLTLVASGIVANEMALIKGHLDEEKVKKFEYDRLHDLCLLSLLLSADKNKFNISDLSELLPMLEETHQSWPPIKFLHLVNKQSGYKTIKELL
ncbi:MAG: hypothetical protein ACOYT8_02610 [Candidatus Dependentiae bacterium]